MVFAVEWGTGQVLWSLTWLFLFALWVILVAHVLGSILFDDGRSALAKAAWLVFVIVMPVVGVIVFVAVNNRGPEGRGPFMGTATVPMYASVTV